MLCDIGIYAFEQLVVLNGELLVFFHEHAQQLTQAQVREKTPRRLERRQQLRYPLLRSPAGRGAPVCRQTRIFHIYIRIDAAAIKAAISDTKPSPREG